MNIHHMGLHLFNFVMWLIIKSQSQSTTFCGTRKPVIKICTSDALTDQTSVNIDSSSIPLYYTISCKCTISPSNLDVEFIFTLKETITNENTVLKINDIVFDANTKEEDKQKATRLYAETDLIFRTSGTARIALCLIVASESQSQSTTFCGTRKPVIKICTNETLTNQTSVNIDSLTVPLYQGGSCKCTISPSNLDAEFIFTLTDTFTTESTLLKINDIVFDANTKEEDKTKTTRLYDETDLIFSTSGTARIAFCLIVSSDNKVKFDITCLKQTAEETNATEALVVPEDKNEQNERFLVPILAASAGVVCIAGVAVVVIVIYRRRSTSEKPGSDTSTTVAEKQNDDDYYMTENPMYDATEIPRKIPNSESEYHYIEHDNHGGCDKIPGTLVGKQISQNHGKSDLHYDYTTCISAVGRKKKTQAKKKTREKIAGNKKEGGSLANKAIVDDQVYDRTDSGKAKQFVSVNEYHHLSPVASRKKRVPETYNTVGNVRNDI